MKFPAIYVLAAILIFLNAALFIGLITQHQSTEPLRIENQRLKEELEKCRRDLSVCETMSFVEIDDDPPERTVAFGKQYVSKISQDALKSSKWTNGDNPPVSLKEAIRVADARREALVQDFDKYQWYRRSATIHFNPHEESECYWRLHYEARYRGMSSGPNPRLDLYVLMDGQLIEPEVSDEEN